MKGAILNLNHPIQKDCEKGVPVVAYCSYGSAARQALI